MIYTHNLMKIFLDTADLEEIRAANATGLIDGVTTNPTLILRSGKTLAEVAQQLVMEFPNFESISTEVVADTAEEMIAQAQQYIKMGPVITVKLHAQLKDYMSEFLIRQELKLMLSIGHVCCSSSSCC